jgi:hypothetical protein
MKGGASSSRTGQRGAAPAIGSAGGAPVALGAKKQRTYTSPS